MHVNGFLREQLQELKARVLVFACADDGTAGRPYLRQRIDVLGGNGLFQPQQPQRLDGLCQRDGRGQVELAVTVDREVDLVADAPRECLRSGR